MQANYGCGDIEEKYDDYTKTYHPGTTGVSCSLLQSPELKHTEESTRLEAQQRPEEPKVDKPKHPSKSRGFEVTRKIRGIKAPKIIKTARQSQSPETKIHSKTF